MEYINQQQEQALMQMQKRSSVAGAPASFALPKAAEVQPSVSEIPQIPALSVLKPEISFLVPPEPVRATRGIDENISSQISGADNEDVIASGDGSVEKPETLVAVAEKTEDVEPVAIEIQARKILEQKPAPKILANPSFEGIIHDASIRKGPQRAEFSKSSIPQKTEPQFLRDSKGPVFVATRKHEIGEAFFDKESNMIAEGGQTKKTFFFSDFLNREVQSKKWVSVSLRDIFRHTEIKKNLDFNFFAFLAKRVALLALAFMVVSAVSLYGAKFFSRSTLDLNLAQIQGGFGAGSANTESPSQAPSEISGNENGIGVIVPVSDKDITEGDIINFSGGAYQLSREDHDPALFGVVNKNPAVMIGNPDSVDGVPVVSAGPSFVRVSTLNGDIKIGDYVTSSVVPGIGGRAEG